MASSQIGGRAVTNLQQARPPMQRGAGEPVPTKMTNAPSQRRNTRGYRPGGVGREPARSWPADLLHLRGGRRRTHGNGGRALATPAARANPTNRGELGLCVWPDWLGAVPRRAGWDNSLLMQRRDWKTTLHEHWMLIPISVAIPVIVVMLV